MRCNKLSYYGIWSAVKGIAGWMDEMWQGGIVRERLTVSHRVIEGS